MRREKSETASAVIFNNLDKEFCMNIKTIEKSCTEIIFVVFSQYRAPLVVRTTLKELWVRHLQHGFRRGLSFCMYENAASYLSTFGFTGTRENYDTDSFTAEQAAHILEPLEKAGITAAYRGKIIEINDGDCVKIVKYNDFDALRFLCSSLFDSGEDGTVTLRRPREAEDYFVTRAYQDQRRGRHNSVDMASFCAAVDFQLI